MTFQSPTSACVRVGLSPAAAVALAALAAAPAHAGAQEVPPPDPGPEHELLASLEGAWEVFTVSRDAELEPVERIGAATARLRLGGRYLEVELRADSGPVRNALYTFGFDRRHGVYTVILMDDSGTYFVTGKGAREGPRIPMYGADDDPVMRSMGYEKEFVIVLDARAPDSVVLETRFIDTRTPERRELPFLAYELRRPR